MKKMYKKKILFCLVVLICAICSTNAMAGMTVKITDSYGTVGGGEMLANPSDFSFSPLTVDASNGFFETFCLERNEYYDAGTEYDVVLNDGAVDGGISGQDPVGGDYDPLDQMTKYLYNEFITSSLAGYDYGTGAARVNSANALQNVIWYIEGEITALPTGLATTFYNEAFNAVNTDGVVTDNVYVMNMSYTYTRRDCVRTQDKQDMLVAVQAIPAPGAILLGSIGVAFVGWLRRKKSL